MKREGLEEMVLGALLRYPELSETFMLYPDSFSSPGRKTLFTAICDADRDESGMAMPEAVGSLSGMSPSEILLLPVAPTLDAAKQRLTKFNQTLNYECLTDDLKRLASARPKGEAAATSLLGALAELIERYRSSDQSMELPTLAGTLRELCKDRKIADMDEARTYYTGISTLDRFIGGVQPGEAMVVAARPGNGKTTFAMQLARTWAEQDLSGVYFTAEMTNRALAERVGYALIEKPVFAGALTEGDYNEIEERIPDPFERVKLSDVSTIRMGEIRRALYNEIERGAGFFIIDNLKHVDGDSDENDRQRLARAIKEIRGVAKEWRVPAVILHHLSRRAEYAESADERSMAWLKNCGDIEEEADIVLFMEADNEHGFDGLDVIADAGIWVMKARRTGLRDRKVPLHFNKRTQCYSCRKEEQSAA